MLKVFSLPISIGPIVAISIAGIFTYTGGYTVWSYILWGLAFVWLIASLIYSGINRREHPKERRLDNVITAKPSITVEPIKRGDVYLLEVTNIGEQAKFEAQISLESEDLKVYSLSDKSHYQACWENAEKHQADIPNGHSRSIKLAELTSYPPQFNILTWNLFYCDASNQENYVSTSSYIIGAYYEDEEGNRTPYEPPCQYRLHVVISSSPSLRGGAFHRDYVISYQRGLENLTLDK